MMQENFTDLVPSELNPRRLGQKTLRGGGGSRLLDRSDAVATAPAPSIPLTLARPGARGAKAVRGVDKSSRHSGACAIGDLSWKPRLHAPGWVPALRADALR